MKLNKKGFSLTSTMVAVALMGVVATALVSILQDMVQGENTAKFLDLATLTHDQIASTLNTKAACLNTFTGSTLTNAGTLTPTTIKDAANVTKYSTGGTYDQILTITSMSVTLATPSPATDTAIKGSLTIVYSAVRKVTGPSTATKTIPMEFRRGTSNAILECIGRAAASEDIWKRISTSNLDIYYLEGNVGIGTAEPAAIFQVYGTGSGAAAASSGTTDATMNSRVCNTTRCIDTGMLDSGTGYIQARSSANLATNYSLALNPNGGFVGIGNVPAPLNRLELASGNNISFGLFPQTAGTIHNLGLHGSSGTWTDGSGAGGFYIKTEADGLSNSVGVITHKSGVESKTRMFIDKTGKVGINTTSPLAFLHLGGTHALQFGSNATATQNYYMQPVLNGAINTFSIYNGNYGSGSLVFRIQANGYVGISQPNPSNRLTSYSYTSGLNGIAGYYSGSTVGPCGALGASGSYYGCLGRIDGYSFVGVGASWNSTNVWTGSDRRLKDDITNIPYGLDVINKLRPVTFQWKENTAEFLSTQSKEQFGLIAQEVQKLLPHAVTEFPWPVQDKKDKTLNKKLGTILGVDYLSLVAVLIKGVQELYEKVKALSGQVHLLEQRIFTASENIKKSRCKRDIATATAAEIEKLKAENILLDKMYADLQSAFCEKNKSLTRCQGF